MSGASDPSLSAPADPEPRSGIAVPSAHEAGRTTIEEAPEAGEDEQLTLQQWVDAEDELLKVRSLGVPPNIADDEWTTGSGRDATAQVRRVLF